MRRLFAALAILLLLGVPAFTRAASTGTPGQNTHRIAGIGVMLANDATGSHRIHRYLVVRGVQDKSPAMEAGVQAGDEIIAVDDFRVAGQDLKSIVEDHLRGEQDSVVQITIMRPGRVRAITFSLVRKIIPMPPDRTPEGPHLS